MNPSVSKPPVFAVGLRDVTCREHEHIVFRGQVSAQPTPSISWYHNGQVIKNRKDVRVMYDGQHASLEIFNISQEDSGNYTCYAVNAAGEIQTDGNLFVQGAVEDNTFVPDSTANQATLVIPNSKEGNMDASGGYQVGQQYEFLLDVSNQTQGQRPPHPGQQTGSRAGPDQTGSRMQESPQFRQSNVYSSRPQQEGNVSDRQDGGSYDSSPSVRYRPREETQTSPRYDARETQNLSQERENTEQGSYQGSSEAVRERSTAQLFIGNLQSPSHQNVVPGQEMTFNIPIRLASGESGESHQQEEYNQLGQTRGDLPYPSQGVLDGDGSKRQVMSSGSYQSGVNRGVQDERRPSQPGYQPTEQVDSRREHARMNLIKKLPTGKTEDRGRTAQVLELSNPPRRNSGQASWQSSEQISPRMEGNVTSPSMIEVEETQGRIVQSNVSRFPPQRLRSTETYQESRKPQRLSHTDSVDGDKARCSSTSARNSVKSFHNLRAKFDAEPEDNPSRSGSTSPAMLSPRKKSDPSITVQGITRVFDRGVDEKQKKQIAGRIAAYGGQSYGTLPGSLRRNQEEEHEQQTQRADQQRDIPVNRSRQVSTKAPEKMYPEQQYSKQQYPQRQQYPEKQQYPKQQYPAVVAPAPSGEVSLMARGVPAPARILSDPSPSPTQQRSFNMPEVSYGQSSTEQRYQPPIVMLGDEPSSSGYPQREEWQSEPEEPPKLPDSEPPPLPTSPLPTETPGVGLRQPNKLPTSQPIRQGMKQPSKQPVQLSQPNKMDSGRSRNDEQGLSQTRSFQTARGGQQVRSEPTKASASHPDKQSSSIAPDRQQGIQTVKLTSTSLVKEATRAQPSRQGARSESNWQSARKHEQLEPAASVPEPNLEPGTEPERKAGGEPVRTQIAGFFRGSKTEQNRESAEEPARKSSEEPVREQISAFFREPNPEPVKESAPQSHRERISEYFGGPGSEETTEPAQESSRKANEEPVRERISEYFRGSTTEPDREQIPEATKEAKPQQYEPQKATDTKSAGKEHIFEEISFKSVRKTGSRSQPSQPEEEPEPAKNLSSAKRLAMRLKKLSYMEDDDEDLFSASTRSPPVVPPVAVDVAREEPNDEVCTQESGMHVQKEDFMDRGPRHTDKESMPESDQDEEQDEEELIDEDQRENQADQDRNEYPAEDNQEQENSDDGRDYGDEEEEGRQANADSNIEGSIGDSCTEEPDMSKDRKFVRQTKPSFIIKPRRCFVDEGKTAKFKASVDGEPAPTVTWNHGGKTLSTGGRYRVYEKDEYHFLEIDEVSGEDKGTYTCVITNKLGTDTLSADLDLFLSRANRLGKPTASTTSAKDVKSKIESLSKAGKAPSSTHHKPSPVSITHKTDIKAKFEKLSQKETETKPEKHSPAGKASWSQTSSSSTTTSKTTPTKKSPGASSSITTTTTTTKRTEVKHTKEDSSIGSAPAAILDTHKRSETAAAKELTKPAAAAAPTKTVKAQESSVRTAGSSSTSSREGSTASSVSSTRQRVRTRPDPHPVVQKIAPKFDSELQDLEVDDGEEAVLECKVTGEPKPTISWMLNEEALLPSDDIQQLYDGKTAQLLFREVFPDDTGLYLAKATNSEGSASTSCVLTVKVPALPEPVVVAPEFRQELEDMTVQDGDAVVMECSLAATPESAQPEPTLSWFKNGEPIDSETSPDFRTTFDGAKARLEIAEVFPEDAGKIECLAVSDVGEASTVATLTVIIPEGDAPPPPVPEELPPEKPPSVPSAAPPVEPPAAETPSTRRVKEPVFALPLQDMTVVDGDSVVLEVQLEGCKPLEVCWLHGKDEIKASSKIYGMEHEGDTYRLLIGEVFPEDGGLYTCEAYNEYGDAETSCVLTVKDKVSLGKGGSESTMPQQQATEFSRNEQLEDGGMFAPEFVVKPKPVNCDEGALVIFVCEVDANPRPKIRWERDGKQLQHGEQYQIFEEGRKCGLEIKQTQASDKGRYFCIAQNEVGEAKCGVSLVVQALQGVDIADFRAVLKTKNKTESKKFVTAPFPQAETKGEQKDFRNVLGKTQKPAPALKDFSIKEPHHPEQQDFRNVLGKKAHDGKPAEKRVESEGKQQDFRQVLQKSVKTKTVPTVAPPTSRSKADQMDFRNVLSKKVQTRERPKVVEELQDIALTEGKSASLSCTIVGIPPPRIVWYHEKKEMKESQYFRMTYENDVATLSIVEVFMDDAGEYICAAINEAGNAQSSCDIMVKESYLKSSSAAPPAPASSPPASLSMDQPDEPPFIEDLQPENVLVLKGKAFQLEGRFLGWPMPEVIWLRGRTLLNHDDHVHIATTKNSSTLSVDTATDSDTGKYTMTITNELGTDSVSASVTVQERPEPPVGKAAASAITSTAMTVSWSGCSYDGGSQVIEYKVEMRSPATPWQTLTSNCQHTSYTVENLEPSTEYQFRISAANKHGFSEPGEVSDPIKTTDQQYSQRGNMQDDLPFEPREVKVIPGRKFTDEFALGEEIGKGRFGMVYKCLERSSGRDFAAKFIKTKPRQKEEIKLEMTIMNLLHHHKLLMLWDAFESPRETILVMEHVAGGELFERIIDEDYILTEAEGVHFMRQICDGVKYMHDSNVLHLDLKPENILCTTKNSNEVKIIDFGLARKFDPKSDTKVLFGTPEFVAPEVINYETIHFATDMWSVGVICYILLSGLSPFLGDTEVETLANVTAATWDFDDETFDEISSDAKDFIQKMLVKNVRKRITVADSLKHKWLSQDIKYMRAKRLSTAKHKKFMARRKWQKTGNAIRALGRMASLQKSLSQIGRTDSRERIRSRPNSQASSTKDGATAAAAGIRTRLSNQQSRDSVLSESSGEQDYNANEKKSLASDSGIALEDTKRRRSGDDVIPTQNGTGGAKKVKFSQEMRDSDVYKDDSARFDVKFVGGGTGTKVKWFKNDMELRESAKYEFRASEDRCSLVVRKCAGNDEGYYECKVVAPNGDSATTGADLYVAGTGH